MEWYTKKIVRGKDKKIRRIWNDRQKDNEKMKGKEKNVVEIDKYIIKKKKRELIYITNYTICQTYTINIKTKCINKMHNSSTNNAIYIYSDKYKPGKDIIKTGGSR